MSSLVLLLYRHIAISLHINRTTFFFLSLYATLFSHTTRADKLQTFQKCSCERSQNQREPAESVFVTPALSKHRHPILLEVKGNTLVLHQITPYRCEIWIVFPPPKRLRTPRSNLSLPPSSFSPHSDLLIDVPAPLKSSSTLPSSSSQIAPNLYTLLENASKSSRKWQAVMIARIREQQLGRRLSLQERNALAAERKLGSGRTLQRYLEKVDSGESLDSIKPTGRKPHVLTQVNDFMLSRAASFQYHFSHAVMVQACREALGVGSESTVARVLKKKTGRRPSSESSLS